jgi:tripartite-type tricarboxylate transporter receptor subunit TctC
LPDVPTIAESLPGFEASLYYGLIAPAGTPRAIIDRLNAGLRAALVSDDVKRKLSQDGTEPTPGTPEDYAAFIDRDETRWAQLIKFLHIAQEWPEGIVRFPTSLAQYCVV